MRRLLLFLLLILISAGSEAGRSSLSGYIKAAGKPLDSVIVHLVSDGGWRFEVAADQSGYFSITGLSPRNYTAIISRKGYETLQYIDVRIDSGKATHLRLDAVLERIGRRETRITTLVYQPTPSWPIAPGRWTASGRHSIDIAALATRTSQQRRSSGKEEAEIRPMQRFVKGVVTGTLKDERDVPVVNAYVEVSSGGVICGRELTDFDGNYTVSPLDSGRYDVTFKFAGKELHITDILLAAAQKRIVDGKMNTSADLTKGRDVIVRAKYSAPMIDAAAPGALATATSSSTYVESEAKAGSLTCGEINDFSKWSLWEDVSYKSLETYQSAWPIRPEKRVSVMVKAVNGMPLPNAKVALLEFGRPIWEAVTDNTGKAELWFEIFGKEEANVAALALRVRSGQAEQIMQAPNTFDVGINVFSTNLPCSNSQKIDFAFLVDATGSMGDEINYLKAELGDILSRITDSMPLTHVQTAAVFYRDRGDEYLVRSSALTDRFAATESFIAANSAGGGGDGPEAVESALEAGLQLDWRPDATARLAFLVLDAPPHGDSVTFSKIQAQVRAYAARGIRLIPVACSGADKPTEYLLRSMALATNGTYLFLTDHSGIGSSHTAPTTDKFDVEYLNQLIYRVIHNFSAMPECEALQLASIDSTGGGSADGKTTTWKYYPNPTQDMLHVDHDEKTGFLYVTDISGKLVQRIAVDPSGHSKVDMSRFPAGVYSIRHSWGVNEEVAGTFVVRH